jgi:hypothetical protein
MGDVFNEQLVRRKTGMREAFIRGGLIAAVVLIGTLAMMMLGQFFLIITAAAGFGAWWVMSFLNIEYEYIFTNGELDIDVIYNRARRKRVLSVNMKEVELMAHINDPAHANTFLGAREVKACGAGPHGADTYAFIHTIGGKRTKVIIDPNEKMLKAISTVMNKRKLFLKSGTVLV